VLFGLCVASSVRVMPAYKFGPSGFVRRSLVFCDFTYLCSLSYQPNLVLAIDCTHTKRFPHEASIGLVCAWKTDALPWALSQKDLDLLP
jgi:hypothetical protein